MANNRNRNRSILFGNSPYLKVLKKRTKATSVSCSSSSSSEESGCFVETTNLGTRIGFTVPLNITALDLKRKLEKEHASCLGEIRVHHVMVKLKSRFYYLTESIPVACIFLDNQKPWFIYAEAEFVNASQEPNISKSIDKTNITPCSGSDKSKKIKNSPAKPNSRNPTSAQNCLDKREFLGSSISKHETSISSSSLARASAMKNSAYFKSFPPKEPEKKDSMSIRETISKKMTVAAKNIRMQGKTQVSSLLSSSIRIRSLYGKTVNSPAKFMVFEVPESED